MGISACLLGQPVRYDGRHKRDAFLAGQLARRVTFVSVCPEVEVGMGVPRPPIRLERAGREVRLRDPEHGLDHTAAMRRWAEARVTALERLGLSGFVLKKDSPSCGLERVKVHPGKGRAARVGVGLFAEALTRRLPLLPVEEEGRLADLDVRERFLARVLAHARVRALFSRRWTVDDLVRFHAAEAPLLLGRRTAAYRALGRLVAEAGRRPRRELARAYLEGVLEALRRPERRARRPGPKFSSWKDPSFTARSPGPRRPSSPAR